MGYAFGTRLKITREVQFLITTLFEFVYNLRFTRMLIIPKSTKTYHLGSYSAVISEFANASAVSISDKGRFACSQNFEP